MPKRSALKGLAASLSGSSSHAVRELIGQETSFHNYGDHALPILESVKRNCLASHHARQSVAALHGCLG